MRTSEPKTAIEETQWETADRLRLIFDIALDAVIVIDTESRIRYWSPQAEKIFGWSRSEAVDQKLYDTVIPPQSKEAHIQGMEHFLTTGEGPLLNRRIEIAARHRDGHEFPVELSILPLESDGTYTFIAFVRDLSDRKRVEEVIHQLASIVEFSNDAIIGRTLDGAIVSWNKGAEQIYGYTAEEVKGQPISILVPPNLSDELPEIHEKLKRGERVEPYETVRIRKDGERIHLSLSLSPIKDAVGNITGISGISRDITDHKRAQQALRESEALYRSLIETSPDAIIVTDLDANILMANLQTIALYGCESAEEIIGKNAFDFIAPEDHPRAMNNMKKVFEGGSVRNIEYTVLKKDGTRFPIELNASLVRDANGNPKAFIGVARDITARKETEEALRKSEEALHQVNEKLMAQVKELEQRTRESALIVQMSELLQACLTYEESYAVISQFAQQLFPDEAGAIFLIDNSRSAVETVTAWGTPPLEGTLFASNECWALRLGRPHLIEDTHSGLLCKHLPDSLPAGYLCAPMTAQGETLGVLHLNWQTGHLTETKRNLGIMVAEQIAMALGNLKLRETLRLQSIRDALTGLFNRRYMEESLEREVYRATRNQYSVGLMMIDLDHFKRINDTFGHEAGDAVLHEVGQFLQDHFRREDVACRYGGEEFMIILPEASLDDTYRRAEQLREAIKNVTIQYHRKLLGPITLSVGVALFPDHGSTGAALIQAADAALYRAKNEGRDRVVIPK
ncbi:PAS domain S-box protein [Candidatus Poribacteria bacterium]|nr:PAS domain S-box protein [Candidatus Poribacteria bacterium]